MSGLFAEAVKELSVDAPAPRRKPEDIPTTIGQPAKVTSKDLDSVGSDLGIVKGDFAKVLAPSLGGAPSLIEEAEMELAKDVKGHSVAAPQTLHDPAEVAQVAQRPKSLFEEVDAEVTKESLPIVLNLEPRKGDTLTARLGAAAKPVLTALSIDEHLIVKGLSKATGLPEKKDISDYTWSTFMKDHGAPDNLLTEAIGLTGSIFLSPMTYVSFGSTAVGKVGGKVALTKEGKRLVNKVVRETADKQVAGIIEAGQLISREGENALRQKLQGDIEQQVLKRFGEINEANKNLDISEAVAKLPEHIKSKGGMKLEVPIGPARGREIPLFNYDAGNIMVFGKTAVTGEEVAKIVKASRIPDLVATIGKSKTLQAAGDDIKATRDYLGKLFIPNFGVDKRLVKAFQAAGPEAEKLLDNPGIKNVDQIQKDIAYITSTWDDYAAKSEDIKNKVYARTEKFFTGMSKKQRAEFANTMIHASGDAAAEISSKDPVVQKALDRWLGRGEFVGKKSVAQFLAEKSKLIEDERLANWFPGIDEAYNLDSLNLRKAVTPAEREFHRVRIGDPDKYTRDPVQAISYRVTEIAYANLQDKFFQNVVDKKLGGLRHFDDAAEAAELGYVPLRRPMAKYLAENMDLAERSKEPTYYVQREFGEYFNKLAYDRGKMNPLLSILAKGTSVWKQNVTSAFPAFHARNFGANIMMNALRIGGHAVEPRKAAAAIEAVIRQRMPKNPESFMDKVYVATARAVFGKDTKAALVTEIGEKLTVNDLLKEAEKFGAIKGGMYQADIGGLNLPTAAQEVWSKKLWNHMNPLSPKFLPSMVGRNFGDAIETQARLVNYMTWRIKGLSPKAAVAEVNEALFNYNAITDFERNLNSAIIPFYTFARKNLENHIKLFAHRPGAITAQFKALRDLGPTEEEWAELPDWAKKKLAVKFRGNILTGFGLPIEDVMEIASHPYEQLQLRSNPILRYAFEQAEGRDIYTDRPLEQINSAKEFKVIVDAIDNPKVPGFVKDALKPIRDFLKLERDPTKPDKIIGDPDKLHFLRSSFTSRYQSVLGQISDEEKMGYEKSLQFMLGVIRLEPNPELTLSIQRRAASKEIAKIMSDTNAAKPLDVVIPVGGDKYTRKVINFYLNELKRAGDVREIKPLLEDFKKEMNQLQEERVKQ